MGWIEEESNIKFLDWGKLKPEHTKDDAIVIKKGEPVFFKILSITTQQENDENDNVVYKYKLQLEGEEKDILMWSNAAIRRQQQKLALMEGEEIEVTYVDDYQTPYGQKGRNIKIRVNRK